jgi:parallel beta-helix repeat protein
MRLFSKSLMICGIMAFLLMLQSCLVSTPSTIITPEIRSLYEGEYTIDPYMKNHVPLSVAVLPFTDLSGSQEGAAAMRLGFYNHFSALPFKDMELYKVDDLLNKAGLTDAKIIRSTPPQKLGQILGVDAVVFGEVSDFDKYFAVLYSQVAVGAEIKMYDAKTGNFLWSGKHKVRKHEGGVSTTPVGIIATVIATSLNVRDIQLLRANDDLFRDMVKTIPKPTLAQAKRPPVITLLTQDTKGKPKKAGDEIKVVIQGAPGMQASFDIGQYRKRIEMQEVEPGGYYGVYKVVPGDNIDKAIVTGYLTDDSGNTTHWVDAIGSVTLDTLAPEKPDQLKSIGRHQTVDLRWGKNPASDLAGYAIYRSETPLSGYRPIGKTELNEFQDADKTLVNSKTYYYRITALDFAGNESQMAQTEGMPIAPGPTPVSGVIDKETQWYSGAGPYILEADVTIKDKAILTIEPGTEIKSKGGGLIVEGRISAQGDNDRIIRFDTFTEGKLWPGITFASVKDRENKLAFVRVRHAKIAINCQASSPSVVASEFTQNADGIRIEGAFSKPVLQKNNFYKNQGTAISVLDGAQPRILENRINDNEKTGIMLLSSAAEILQNTIARNKHNGITVKGSESVIRHNNIIDNQPFNVSGEFTGTSAKALDNWWGTSKMADILRGLQGRIDVQSVLDAPYPQGKTLPAAILDKKLSGIIKSDSYLILANSPYRISGDLIIDEGATLYIEPGVVLEFDQKTSIIAQNGGVIARGTKEKPITFTASSSSPAPGFYASAVRFSQATKINSSFSYCIVKYATTAFDIYEGSPEISKTYIAHSSQNAIYCRKDASPVISQSTFESNQGEGAITCVGSANPKIFQNNFINNAVAIQSFSTIYLDARNNWWGASPPDGKIFFGENINTKPWLEHENPDAFREKSR